MSDNELEIDDRSSVHSSDSEPELEEGQQERQQGILRSQIHNLDVKSRGFTVRMNTAVGTSLAQDHATQGYVALLQQSKNETDSEKEFYQAVLDHGGTHQDATDFLCVYFSQHYCGQSEEPNIQRSLAGDLASMSYLRDTVERIPRKGLGGIVKTEWQLMVELAIEFASQVVNRPRLTSRIEDLSESRHIQEWIHRWEFAHDGTQGNNDPKVDYEEMWRRVVDP
ncbi:uncharacterized protein L199_001365 [Kwoniella botswanensis]|uniref:uncharacterized protein n=1 Tax=Kwoniella botswanensis TaxID=1268659 RepID=UPI00315D8CEC